ncbi:CBN-NHR-19 protein, partial [Aphelenchoides avenae]
MSSPDRDSLGSDEVRSPASDTSDMPALKDCRICGKDASGMHYGCQSCSRCKAFFRRAVLSSVTTQCCRAMLCAKTDCIEQMCRSCRYKKCLDMGMDPKAIHPPHDTIGKRQRPSSAVSIVEMPSAPMDINSNQLEFMAQLTFMDNTIRRKKLESVWQRSGFVLPIELANSPRGFAMPNDMADMARADIFSLTEWLRTIPIMDDLSSDEQRTLCMR